MAKCFSFSFFIVAILFFTFYIHDSESVFGILTPVEGKRGVEKGTLGFVDRKSSMLKAIQAKLQRREAFRALPVMSKMVCTMDIVIEESYLIPLS